MIAALALAAIAELAPPRAAGLNPAEMSADAIKALEQRLTDAGCYKGAIDARASDALDEGVSRISSQKRWRFSVPRLR